MSAIGSIAPGLTARIQQAPPPPAPAKADNDGDEAGESAAAKASESGGSRALNVVA